MTLLHFSSFVLKCRDFVLLCPRWQVNCSQMGATLQGPLRGGVLSGGRGGVGVGTEGCGRIGPRGRPQPRPAQGTPLAPVVPLPPPSLLLSGPGAPGPPARPPDLCFTAGSWLGVGALRPLVPNQQLCEQAAGG